MLAFVINQYIKVTDTDTDTDTVSDGEASGQEETKRMQDEIKSKQKIGTIFSLQYTFGRKAFDDPVYIEVSAPKGQLTNKDAMESSIACAISSAYGRR